MLVEFGNVTPVTQQRSPALLDAPAVTYISVPDSYSFDSSLNHRDAAVHLAQNPIVTNLPDNEAFVGCLLYTSDAADE